MKFLKFLLLGVGLWIFSDMSALEFPWLSFKMNDATEITVAADNLVMQYADGNLTLSSETVNQIIPVADVISMKFVDKWTGIDNINDAFCQPTVYYTLAGIEVGEFPSASEARRALPSGTYIVKSPSGALKIIF